MKTDIERAKQYQIAELIDAQIKKALPECTISNGHATIDGDISLHVSHPREYMGRFDAGKVYWTIDLKEGATYSRTRQVRVKVDGDTVRFDTEKLVSHLNALREIVAAKRKLESDRLEMENALPPLPLEMTVKPLVGTGEYLFDISLRGTAADVQKAAEWVKAFKLGLDANRVS